MAPQVLTELWVIATRPVEVNGFGWSPAATSARAHDAHLAAVMLSQGISQILTLNPVDFQGMQGVVAVLPSAIAAG